MRFISDSLGNDVYVRIGILKVPVSRRKAAMIACNSINQSGKYPMTFYIDDRGNLNGKTSFLYCTSNRALEEGCLELYNWAISFLNDEYENLVNQAIYGEN